MNHSNLKGGEFFFNSRKMPAEVAATLTKITVISSLIILHVMALHGNAIVITVARDGSANFTTIQAAINSLLPSATRRTIHIRKDVYMEKVTVKAGLGPITMQGDGAGVTIITWSGTAGDAGSLAGSATVAVSSDDFIAADLTVQNSSPDPGQGAVDKQAVALMVAGDRAAFYRLKILGYQDTLLDSAGRHFYSNCYIAGTIDFICGKGRSLFDKCTVDYVGKFKGGVITAQAKDSPFEDSGFLFENCRIVASAAGSVRLGRAWGNFATVAFYNTRIDVDVASPVWDNWEKDPQNFKFLEVNSTGIGASAKRPEFVKKSLSLIPLGLSFINGSSWLSAPWG